MPKTKKKGKKVDLVASTLLRYVEMYKTNKQKSIKKSNLCQNRNNSTEINKCLLIFNVSKVYKSAHGNKIMILRIKEKTGHSLILTRDMNRS